tara:strand:- start:26505 stop:26606 length:102 start_codon:yes stop_codon:yes gene_type:complete
VPGKGQDDLLVKKAQKVQKFHPAFGKIRPKSDH